MRNSLLLGGGLALFLSTASMAAPLRTTNHPLPESQSRKPEVLPDLSQKTWWLFLSLDLGGISYSSVNSAIEGARSGFQFGGRLLLSKELSDFVMDGGLGWKSISAKGTNPATSFQASTVDTISTKVPYVDLSIRYRIGPKFQIGPEFEFWMGTDNGLNDYIASTETNRGKFIGIEFDYEWARYRKYRWGAKVLTSLGVPSRTVTQYVAFYQIGFDVFDSTEAPVRKKSYEQISQADLEKAESLTPKEAVPMGTPTSTEEMGYSEPAPDVMSTPAPPSNPELPEATPTPVPVPVVEPVSQSGAPVPAKKLILSMGFNDLPFGFNDSQLPPAHQARVKNMGHYLSDHQKAWKTLVVSGHTDERGSEKFNMNMSFRRAETVRRLLIQGGAPANRIKAMGYGESRPIDKAHNEKAWARNRRVELEFLGVRDASVIKHALDQ